MHPEIFPNAVTTYRASFMHTEKRVSNQRNTPDGGINLPPFRLRLGGCRMKQDKGMSPPTTQIP